MSRARKASVSICRSVIEIAFLSFVADQWMTSAITRPATIARPRLPLPETVRPAEGLPAPDDAGNADEGGAADEELKLLRTLTEPPHPASNTATARTNAHRERIDAIGVGQSANGNGVSAGGRMSWPFKVIASIA
jgi:hypothetical protein